MVPRRDYSSGPFQNVTVGGVVERVINAAHSRHECNANRGEFEDDRIIKRCCHDPVGRDDDLQYNNTTSYLRRCSTVYTSDRRSRHQGHQGYSFDPSGRRGARHIRTTDGPSFVSMTAATAAMDSLHGHYHATQTLVSIVRASSLGSNSRSTPGTPMGRGTLAIDSRTAERQ